MKERYSYRLRMQSKCGRERQGRKERSTMRDPYPWPQEERIRFSSSTHVHCAFYFLHRGQQVRFEIYRISFQSVVIATVLPDHFSRAHWLLEESAHCWKRILWASCSITAFDKPKQLLPAPERRHIRVPVHFNSRCTPTWADNCIHWAELDHIHQEETKIENAGLDRLLHA